MIVARIDGGEGGCDAIGRPDIKAFHSYKHSTKNYHSVFSSDGGYRWTTPRVMRDITGRGMGTAYPRLLMLGDKGRGTPQRLLLAGGRLFTEGLVDIELWVSSDGMGIRWDQVHSLSYQHNRNVVNPLQRLFHQVNLTVGVNSTTSCE